ncbi:MAG: hypothetical protein ACPG7F_10590 [Aggregatilineales bacterium]
MTVLEILDRAKELNQNDRKELVKLIEDTFEDDRGTVRKKKKHSILEFEGIGKHLADGEDPQDYVNRLRTEEWNDRP